MNQKKYIPYMTIVLVAVNVIVYLVMEIAGSTNNTVFMLEHGAMYPPLITENGEWWRLFTCMFLHFGISHIFNNMLVLTFLGASLEELLGHFKFLLFYLICGVCASGASMAFMELNHDFAVSAGASGAIFGVVGGILAYGLLNRGNANANIAVRRLVLYLFLSIYLGAASEGVDFMAHIGGLAAGVILCGIGILFHKKHTL